MSEWGKWRGVSCSIDGCGRPATCKGFCGKHYVQDRVKSGRHPPSRNAESWRIKRIKSRYGIDGAGYDALLRGQSGVCAICRTPAADRGAPAHWGQKFCIDHDHATGKVRGLLCNDCNLMVGYSGDDPDRLIGAARYLAGHGMDCLVFEFDEIVSITPCGREEVYDIQVDRTENFLADGLVSHNTRWHHDDPAGRILEREAGRWRVLSLPALAEEDDALGREVGEPLWPEWEGLSKLLDKQLALGGPESRDWLSQFQQRPSSESGTLFMVAKIGMLEALPPIVRRVRAWDLAATEAGAVVGRGKAADPDWTVGLLLARTDLGRYVIEDVVRFRGRPEEVERRILETARSDGSGVMIGLPQDPGQAGKAQVAYLVSKLAGYQVLTSTESGAKATRAMPLVAQCNVGNLSMMTAHWNNALISELREFPAGRNDDQVDAASRAFAMLVVAARPARNVPIGIMAR